MVPGHGRPLTPGQSQSGATAGLMVFDCRGFEPVEFSFGDGWKAESVSISSFLSCNLIFFVLLITNSCLYSQQLFFFM